MHHITVVLHVQVDDDRLLIQLNNFHLLRLTNMENPDMEPFPVYCNRFVLLKVEEKFYKLIIMIQYMNLLNVIETFSICHGIKKTPWSFRARTTFYKTYIMGGFDTNYCRQFKIQSWNWTMFL